MPIHHLSKSKLVQKARISSFDPQLWPIDESFSSSRLRPISGRLSLPSSSVRHESAEITWKKLQADPHSVFDIPLHEESYFTIVPDGLTSKELDLDVLLIRKDTPKLLVVFHGALDRAKFTLPRMEYKRSLRNFEGSVLLIQDPTLYTHKDLGLGWYVGTDKDNAHAMVSELIRNLTAALKPSQLVLTGGSGGGFAAMAVSARIPKSLALAFSPQTALEKYYINHRKRLISSAFPSLISDPENLSLYEDRFDLGALYANGADNRVLYVQNTGDPFHIKNHSLPFMQSVGLDLSEGEMRNERITMEYSYLRKGHGGPSPKQMNYYVAKVFNDGVW